MARNDSYSGNHSNSTRSTTAQQLEAQQAAAAQRRRIQTQINTKNSQISKYNSIVSELQSEKNDITSSIQKWTDAKVVFNQEEIAKTVEVKNVFEGLAARYVNTLNASKIKRMDERMSSATSIKDSISFQESRINTQISTLKTEIANLKSQL